MKTYSWWRGRKWRIKKKYFLFFGQYYSPKELKELVRKLKREGYF